MARDEHGSCVNCGYDLNGDLIWDHFFNETGDEGEATRIAQMYGAVKGVGRFGKEIYFKPYDDNYNELPSYHICPECREKCYGTTNT